MRVRVRARVRVRVRVRVYVRDLTACTPLTCVHQQGGTTRSLPTSCRGSPAPMAPPRFTKRMLAWTPPPTRAPGSYTKSQLSIKMASKSGFVVWFYTQHSVRGWVRHTSRIQYKRGLPHFIYDTDCTGTSQKTRWMATKCAPAFVSVVQTKVRLLVCQQPSRSIHKCTSIRAVLDHTIPYCVPYHTIPYHTIPYDAMVVATVDTTACSLCLVLALFVRLRFLA